MSLNTVLHVIVGLKAKMAKSFDVYVVVCYRLFRLVCEMV